MNLPLMMPTIHIRTTVEKNGIILSDKWEVGHSWVKNAWCFFHGMMLDIGGFGTPPIGSSWLAPGMLLVRDTGGTGQ